MSPDVEHALALWRAYDLATIESRRATDAAVVASKTWNPPKSRRRQMSPEAWACLEAEHRHADAKRAAEGAYRALCLVFDESPNEGRAADELVPADPPEPVAVGTRASVTFRQLFPGMPPSSVARGCDRDRGPGE